MTSMTFPKVISTTLQHHLKSQLPTLLRSSCLLISSQPPPHNYDARTQRPNQKRPKNGLHDATITHVSDFVKKSVFTSTIQYNLPCVQSNISSAFPTDEAIESSLAMARRSGSQTILAVGSGSAMDLAKAVAKNMKPDGSRLIMVPGTVGAVMACTSELPLVFNPKEEALLVPPDNLGTTDMTVVLDEHSLFLPQLNMSRGGDYGEATVGDALLGSLAICVDASMASDSMDQDMSRLIYRTATGIVETLDQILNGDECDRSRILDALSDSGKIASFGKSHGMRRAVPVAFASALLPTYFPNANLLTFYASCLHGLCEEYENDDNFGHLSSRINRGNLADFVKMASSKLDVPSMGALAEEAPDIDDMLDKIDANGALWGCKDEDENILKNMLHSALDK